MQLSPRYLVRRRFSNTAAAMVVISLVVASAGALSVLAANPPAYSHRAWQELPRDAAPAGRFVR